jgi:hypothetical protein
MSHARLSLSETAPDGSLFHSSRHKNSNQQRPESHTP